MTSFKKSPTRLYKNPVDGKFMGVCAGIADYLGISTTPVRILTVIGFFTPLSFFIFVGYFILGFMLEPAPVDLYEDEQEEEFWKQTRKSPDYTAAELRRRFRDIERRTNEMEAFMTSKRFRLERELRALED